MSKPLIHGREFEVPLELEHMRNRKFTGREHLLSQLHNSLKQSIGEFNHRPVALHGIGGVGKTQIAVEYAYRHRAEYSAIIWIDATSLESTKRSFLKALNLVVKTYEEQGLEDSPGYRQLANVATRTVLEYSPAKNEDDTATIDALKFWLSNEKNDRWLLIVDNVDDLESFGIWNFLPKTSHGSIMITSRRPELAGIWTGIEVEEMSEEEAFDLLERCSNSEVEIGSKGMFSVSLAVIGCCVNFISGKSMI